MSTPQGQASVVFIVILHSSATVAATIPAVEPDRTRAPRDPANHRRRRPHRSLAPAHPGRPAYLDVVEHWLNTTSGTTPTVRASSQAAARPLAQPSASAWWWP